MRRLDSIHAWAVRVARSLAMVLTGALIAVAAVSRAIRAGASAGRPRHKDGG